LANSEATEAIDSDTSTEMKDYGIEEKNFPKQYPWLLGYHLAKGRDEVILTATAADTLTALNCLAVPAVCLPSGIHLSTRWHSQSDSNLKSPFSFFLFFLGPFSFVH
jgi:hypothetical protein